jgi:molybdopterin converting factor small subunit
MSVRVELFGIVRHRAGVGELEVEAATLGEVLQAAGDRLPDLRGTCIEGNRLRCGFLANINGKAFVSDPAMRLAAGDCVLILSADPGG